MEKKNTRQRVLEAALDLFSEKGYDGVGVDLIAETVGMKGPSLYKHFKGKADILDSLIEQLNAYYEEHMQTKAVFPASLQEMTEFAMEQVHFTLSDLRVRKIRKLLTLEQYRGASFAEMATFYFQTIHEKQYADVFAFLMAQGKMKQEDPRVLAMQFSAPISMLIHLCDRQPEKTDEAMEQIRNHISLFVKTWEK